MQTAYLGLQPLQFNLPYNGGLCIFYYADFNDIQQWAAINPNTQEYYSAPVLKSGSTWKGPIKIANNSLQYKEVPRNTPAGLVYDLILDFNQFGSNRTNRNIVENLVYYQLVIVAKVRAGGYYLVIGNSETGAKANVVEDAGKGQFSNFKSDFTISLKSKNKALVLPSFLDDNSESVNGITTPAPGLGNDYEQINFTTTDAQPIVNINWDNSRKSRFGNFPIIEVWSTAFGNPQLDTSSNITCNSNNNPTQFSINRTGADTGFIIIK